MCRPALSNQHCLDRFDALYIDRGRRDVSVGQRNASAIQYVFSAIR